MMIIQRLFSKRKRKEDDSEEAKVRKKYNKLDYLVNGANGAIFGALHGGAAANSSVIYTGSKHKVYGNTKKGMAIGAAVGAGLGTLTTAGIHKLCDGKGNGSTIGPFDAIIVGIGGKRGYSAGRNLHYNYEMDKSIKNLNKAIDRVNNGTASEHERQTINEFNKAGMDRVISHKAYQTAKSKENETAGKIGAAVGAGNTLASSIYYDRKYRAIKKAKERDKKRKQEEKTNDNSKK